MIDKNISSKGPVFIVGAPRSGTTLTAKILGSHSNIFMPGETHFFEDIYARRQEFGSDINALSIEPIIERLSTLYGRFNEAPDQGRIDTLFQDKAIVDYLRRPYSCYGEILSRFMEVQMRHLGKQRWGNNTPRDIFYVRDILTYFPDAIFIVCVRDVRDFLRSYKTKWKTVAGARSSRLKSLYHPIVTSLLWKSSIKCIFDIEKNCSKENYLVVPYEELVADPENTTKEICQVIGEDYEAGMLDVQGNNSSREENKGERRGIYSSSVGTWREELSAEEIYIAQTICSGELAMLGYSAERIKVSWYKVAVIILTAPYTLIKGMKANKHKRGPLGRYIFRRLASFFRKS